MEKNATMGCVLPFQDTATMTSIVLLEKFARTTLVLTQLIYATEFIAWLVNVIKDNVLIIASTSSVEKVNIVLKDNAKILLFQTLNLNLNLNALSTLIVIPTKSVLKETAWPLIFQGAPWPLANLAISAQHQASALPMWLESASPTKNVLQTKSASATDARRWPAIQPKTLLKFYFPAMETNASITFARTPIMLDTSRIIS